MFGVVVFEGKKIWDCCRISFTFMNTPSHNFSLANILTIGPFKTLVLSVFFLVYRHVLSVKPSNWPTMYRGPIFYFFLIEPTCWTLISLVVINRITLEKHHLIFQSHVKHTDETCQVAQRHLPRWWTAELILYIYIYELIIKTTALW